VVMHHAGGRGGSMEEDLSTSNIPVAQRRNSRIPPSLSTLRTKVRVVLKDRASPACQKFTGSE
jgi:hypothetical protein